jgi:hypothetical protein
VRVILGGMRFAVLTILLIAISGAALAQPCPVKRQPKRTGSGYDSGLAPSAPQTISGTIIYHENLRNWLSLRPEAPVCGQPEFELWISGVSFDVQNIRKRIERSRGCKTTVTGRLSFETNKQYATAIVLEVGKLAPDPSCTLKPELPDNAQLKPKTSIRKYEVQMTVSLIGNGSVHVVARSQNQRLQPWQAYMTYSLDGEHIFSATCGYGFVVSNVSSKPAGASQSRDDAVLDIAPFSGSTSPIVITYSCTRVVPPEH